MNITPAWYPDTADFPVRFGADNVLNTSALGILLCWQQWWQLSGRWSGTEISANSTDRERKDETAHWKRKIDRNIISKSTAYPTLTSVVSSLHPSVFNFSILSFFPFHVPPRLYALFLFLAYFTYLKSTKGGSWDLRVSNLNFETIWANFTRSRYLV